MPRKKKLKTAATLTIHRAGDMDLERRREIAGWLRRQARILMKRPGKLAKRYTARWQY